MAKYTTEVRSICETMAGYLEPAGYGDIEDIITEAAPLVFNFDFPIFDEDYRLPLEKKILRHYYTREIGEETVGLWKLRLCDKLNVIMPYYNKLYESELLDFNPLYDVDLTTTHTRNVDGSNEGSSSIDSSGSVSSSDSGENWSKYSDTPQGGLTGVDSDTYLTNARHDTNSTSGSQSSSSNSESSSSETSKTVEEYTEKISGKRNGTNYSKLLKEFRESFLNIDSLVISELSDLFLNLW